MERVVRRCRSLAESDEAEQEYYLTLTPEQRLDVPLELVAQYREGLDEAAQGFQIS